jgi:hypothetical protein
MRLPLSFGHLPHKGGESPTRPFSAPSPTKPREGTHGEERGQRATSRITLVTTETASNIAMVAMI